MSDSRLRLKRASGTFFPLNSVEPLSPDRRSPFFKFRPLAGISDTLPMTDFLSQRSENSSTVPVVLNSNYRLAQTLPDWGLSRPREGLSRLCSLNTHFRLGHCTAVDQRELFQPLDDPPCFGRGNHSYLVTQACLEISCILTQNLVEDYALPKCVMSATRMNLRPFESISVGYFVARGTFYIGITMICTQTLSINENSASFERLVPKLNEVHATTKGSLHGSQRLEFR